MIHSLNAVSPLLCRLIPKLFFPLDQPQQDAATVKGVGYSEQFLCEIVAPSSDCNGSYTFLQHANINSLPGPFNVCFPYLLSGNSQGCYHRNIDTALSRVVCLLSQSLLTSASKYLTVSVFFLCVLNYVWILTLSQWVGWTLLSRLAPYEIQLLGITILLLLKQINFWSDMLPKF